jgi:hypothetical protein
VASSKKTSPSKRKSAKSKATETKIEDATIIEEVVPNDPVVEDHSVETTEDTASATTDIPSADVEASDEIVVEETSEEIDVDPVAEDSELEAPIEVTTSDDAALEVESEEVDSVSDKVIEENASQEAAILTSVEEKNNIFLPLVLGGIVAGVVGFAASQMNLFGGGDADITTKLRNDLNNYQERLVAVETTEAPVVEMPDLSPIQEKLTAIEVRISELEARPAIVVPEDVGGEAAAAYAAELQALQSSVIEQRGEIEALLNNAKSVEQATSDAATEAKLQAAVAKIVSAIDAGQPFAEPFADLQALDIGEVDPALGAVAAEGVATLNTLQTAFPDQARAALATARASGVGEGQQGIGGFLTRALGARSVAPREGDDPDAVLSRAEAAIKAGDLNTTLTELDTLPEEAQAVIVEWRTAADARVAARAAADALAQRLTADEGN